MSHDRRSDTPAGCAGLSRRAFLTGAGVAALSPWAVATGYAQEATLSRPVVPGASQLPLKTTGLEHLGTVVPDVAAAGRFYGRLFNPLLYKEKAPPLRYYVTLGRGYLALGSRASASHAFFDHFCALVEDYDAPAMAQQLQAQNLPAGRFGIIPDPDGLGLQLLATPGGLAKSTEPAGQIVEEGALVNPIGLDHVVLHVSDLGRSLDFYRRFFGAEETHSPRSGQAWFQIAATRLGLEKAATGESPRVDRIGIKVQHFERAKVGRELTKMGARLGSSSADRLRFTDPIGLSMELLTA